MGNQDSRKLPEHYDLVIKENDFEIITNITPDSTPLKSILRTVSCEDGRSTTSLASSINAGGASPSPSTDERSRRSVVFLDQSINDPTHPHKHNSHGSNKLSRAEIVNNSNIIKNIKHFIVNSDAQYYDTHDGNSMTTSFCAANPLTTIHPINTSFKSIDKRTIRQNNTNNEANLDELHYRNNCNPHFYNIHVMDKKTGANNMTCNKQCRTVQTIPEETLSHNDELSQIKFYASNPVYFTNPLPETNKSKHYSTWDANSYRKAIATTRRLMNANQCSANSPNLSSLTHNKQTNNHDNATDILDTGNPLLAFSSSQPEPRKSRTKILKSSTLSKKTVSQQKCSYFENPLTTFDNNINLSNSAIRKNASRPDVYQVVMQNGQILLDSRNKDQGINIYNFNDNQFYQSSLSEDQNYVNKAESRTKNGFIYTLDCDAENFNLSTDL